MLLPAIGQAFTYQKPYLYRPKSIGLSTEAVCCPFFSPLPEKNFWQVGEENYKGKWGGIIDQVLHSEMQQFSTSKH